MAKLVYGGSALDHTDTPPEYQLGQDGKVLKSRGQPIIIKPGKRTFVPLDVYKLWGVEFPKGVVVEVEDEKLVKKAMALGCFAVLKDGEEPKPLEPQPAPMEVPTTQPATADDPTPMKRGPGRPRKGF